ncbi:uncharacterized protein DSM5745_07207 [Aspergillus mulundensis]|uniref:Uncharacterized protein n=1 Tax=Aspergillus mulundensis TaxID=1810919 RepID=A0A3D8RKH4_9EURO|nr:hypothetical protein DSM5745_07207 [Aspergillus mulundensis]RDW74545.1 hypothetical protein DSM5745_07207 [Aspergillus mulundensis]
MAANEFYNQGPPHPQHAQAELDSIAVSERLLSTPADERHDPAIELSPSPMITRLTAVRIDTRAAATPRRATTSSRNSPTTLPRVVTSSLTRKARRRNLAERRRTAGVWEPVWRLSAAASCARKPANAASTALSAARCAKRTE